MTRLRRHRVGILALLCAGFGVLLLLLAIDVRTWQATVARDDLRFRALPDHRSLWRPPALLPADPAGHLLGTGDTIAYRRALQLFWFSRLGMNPETGQDPPTTRAEAQQRLAGLATSAARPSERSAAANLLGIITVTTPVSGSDQAAITKLLRDSATYFQRAIDIDPQDTDAKQNLELVLRLTRPGKGKFGRDARSGYGFGRGHSATPIGSGY